MKISSLLRQSLALAVATFATTAAFAQDADLDGVPDNVDAFPCDATLAGLAFAPGENQHGMLLFEDLWPEVADEDFNDVAVAYNYVYYLDGSGRVTRVRLTMTPLALGGLYDNGLGLHLPIPRQSVASVTRSVAGGAAEAITPSATDSELTFVVSPNLRELFGDAAGPINSQATVPRRFGQPIVVDVQLSTPVSQMAGSAPHDLYIFRLSDPGHEIHQRAYPGTSQMNVSYFNTQDDNSSTGAWFVDGFGLPSAIVVPLSAPYPSEITSIAQLFPDITSWATSGGTQNQDFYATNVDQAYAYRDSSGQGALTPAAPRPILRNRSCVATDVSFTTDTTVDASNVGTLMDQNWIISPNVTVTIDYDQTIRVNALDVQGQLVPASCTLNDCANVDIEVVSDATIHPGGSIDADATGYRGGRRDGNGYIGRTRHNAVANASPTTGGSHGGFGGRNGATVGQTYDDLYHPALPGGGGSSAQSTSSSYTGGHGGGAVRLAVAGTLTLDGIISANGGRGASYDGGGAGGSVWIDAANIVSNTSGVHVRANGSYGYYAGGGGGRVAIYGPTTGWSISSATVQVNGGSSASAASRGSAGTIVYGGDAPGQANLLLTTSSGFNSQYSDLRIGAFGTVSGLSATVLTTARVLEPDTLVGRTLRPDVEQPATFVIASNTANTITIASGDLTNATATGRSFYVTDYQTSFANVTLENDVTVDAGYLDVAQDLSLAQSTQLDVFDVRADRVLLDDTAQMTSWTINGRIYQQSASSISTARVLNATNASLQNSASLRAWDSTLADFFPLTITAGDFDVGAGTTVLVSERGYLGGRRDGNGYRGRTFGNVAAPSSATTGGSHGGYGGRNGATVAEVYGNPYFPNTAGGGGSSAQSTSASYTGGHGGGVLRISVANDFTLDGLLDASGGRGASYDAGGAGGSIWIDATQIIRTVSGVGVRSNGSYGYYAGGGGGRIAIHYGQLAGWAVDASTVQAVGGTAASASQRGGVGTILYRHSSEPNGRLLISGAHNSEFSNTRLGAFGVVTAVSGQTLTTSAPLVPDTLAGATLAPDVAQSTTFTVVGNTENTITVQESGLTSATAVGRSFSVLDYQTQFEEVILENQASLSVGQLTVSQNLAIRDNASIDAHDLFATNIDVANTTTVYAHTLTGQLVVLRGSSQSTLQNITATTLDLQDTAMVQNWAPTLSTIYPLRIDATTLNHGAGALIHTNARGYLGGRRDGNGYRGRTIGNVPASSSAATGGSHGGYGGRNGATVTGTYGDILFPSAPGAGGSSAQSTSSSYTGGNGGGVIHVVVPGIFTLDGRIEANGGRGASYDGGGAGGSILIEAGTIIRSTAPSVILRADGSYGYYAGGGGGRIALHFDALSGFVVDQTMISVNGGAAASAASRGGSGTIAGWPSAQVNPNLIVNAPSGFNSYFAATPIGAFGDVTGLNIDTLTSSRELEPGALVGYTLVPDAESPSTTFPITANSATTITVLGDLSQATAAGRRWYVADYLTQWDDVTFRGDATIELGYLDVANDYLQENTANVLMSSMDVNAGQIVDATTLYGVRFTANDLDTAGTAFLTLRVLESAAMDLMGSTRVLSWAPSLTAVYPLVVLADDFVLGASAQLDASSHGYLGGRRDGNGYYGRTDGNVPASSSFTVGGSHGGLGGGSGTVTPTFGSATQPMTFGAGGTSAQSTSSSYTGGNGGGVVRVVVAQTFDFAGRIHANGGRGSSYDSGGAGGSVWVTAGTFLGNGGRLDANGSYGYYAGGGGGRISVEATNVTSWGTSGATAQVLGGTASSAASYGDAGTTRLNGG